MADTNNPEVKKNDASGKETPVSNANTSAKSNTTVSNGSTKSSTPITPTPVVKMAIPQQEVKYPIEDLIENSKALTGYGKEVAVGALFNCKEKELTKADFKKAIDEFLKRKVK
ncbi:hypothetical protein ACSVC9_10430 [Clostridium sp. LBM24168]